MAAKTGQTLVPNVHAEGRQSHSRGYQLRMLPRSLKWPAAFGPMPRASHGGEQPLSVAYCQATLGYLWLEWVVCLSHNDSLAPAIIRGSPGYSGPRESSQPRDQRFKLDPEALRQLAYHVNRTRGKQTFQVILATKAILRGIDFGCGGDGQDSIKGGRDRCFLPFR